MDPRQVKFVYLGQIAVSDEDVAFKTVLGSCVSACIRDEQAGCGGMNHFNLPHKLAHADCQDVSLLRYGEFAMQQLIDDLLAMGARMQRMEACVYGGSNMGVGGGGIGQSNIEYALSFLKKCGLAVSSQDLGGNYARSVIYAPKTGQVTLQRISSRPASVRQGA